MACAAHRGDAVPTTPQTDDAIPEPLTEPFQTKRTVELCGQEQGRMRCTRTKGHDGQHESLAVEGSQRW